MVRSSDEKLAQKYRDILLDSDNFATVFLDQAIAEEAARLRAFYNIRTPDAIQMATATIGKAACFLTNDAKLPTLPNLKILVLDDLKREFEGPIDPGR